MPNFGPQEDGASHVFLERQDIFSGQGWLSTLLGFDGLLGSKKFKGMSFTASFGNGCINLDNGMHEKFKTVSGYVCNRLFSISEDGFETRGMTSI